MIFGHGGLFSSGGEKRRLVMFAVLFVVVLGIFWREMKREEAPRKVAQETERQLLPESMRVQPARVDEEFGMPKSAVTVTDRNSVIEKDYLFELLDTAKRMPLEEIKSRSERVPFQKFFDDPENWRGKIIHVEGKTRRLVKRQKQEVSDGLEGLYEAQVMDSDGYWYYVFIAEEPSFGTGELVVFDGIFMKVYGYENRRGTVTLAPLFVCKNFERMELEPLTMHRTTGLITLAAVILGAVAAVFIARSQRRESEVVALAVEDKRLEKARRWARSREGGEQES